METMTEFLSLGSKITVDGDCSHEIFSPWKKSYEKPRQHLQKQRHHFAEKKSVYKATVLPVVTYRCESWTIKKAEHQRTDAFELCC